MLFALHSWLRIIKKKLKGVEVIDNDMASELLGLDEEI